MIPRGSRGNLKSEPLKAAEMKTVHEQPGERSEESGDVTRSSRQPFCSASLPRNTCLWCGRNSPVQHCLPDRAQGDFMFARG